MPSAYLVRKRTQFEALRSEIEGVQNLATSQNRDLTEAELTDVRAKADEARTLAGEIESLTEFETRSAAVNALAADLATPPAPAAQPVETRSAEGEGAEGDEQDRAAGDRLTGNAQVTHRDPGHYRRGGEFSFFGDMYRSSQLRDETARGRLDEHTRALATGVAGAGVVPPKWLVDEFETLARQGRKLASAVRNVSIAGDPRPITIPGQTAGVDAVVAEQAAENNAVGEADAWESGVDTIVPKPTAGAQVFSRQMLDMANPAIDSLIYGDLIAVYNLKIEQKVGAAMIAAATTPVVTLADEEAFVGVPPATPALDAIVDAQVAVRSGRKVPADVIAMGVARYGKFLKLRDTTGRPLINRSNHGPMNVVGVGDVQTDGEIEGLGVIVTDGINTGTYPDSLVVARASDTILFEGDVMRFRYEEVSGPQSIKLGIWAYSAVTVRYASTNSVARVQVTVADAV